MTDAPAKKRLGQYFSGAKVANLLIDLCAPTTSNLVIDPMAGTGDMLAAAIRSGIPAENTCGIEIDPEAGSRCRKRIKPGNVYIGDAFSPEPYTALGHTAWDLVITNPPYVRYQSIGGFEGEGILIKSAKETRQCLSELVNGISQLDKHEKKCFQQIIRHYSGLSDLAVPAWLLCAALTKVGGRLAMVVPESWISRDYALSIKYMLMKFFDVEYIVEDLNSLWFSDALVKTNLLVAKRVKFRESLNEIGDSVYKHIQLGAGLIGESSLVEKLKINGREGRAALKSLIDNGEVSGEDFEVRQAHLSSLLSEISASPIYGKFMKKLEPHTNNVMPVSIPKELQQVIGGDVPSTNLTEIGAWGVKVGQGLRTGANRFFYAKLYRSEGAMDYLVTDRIFGERILPVAQKYALPAFRYQSDVLDRAVISKAMLSHRLLYIQEDFYTDDGNLQDAADAPLEKHIREAAGMTINSCGRSTRFPDLSAVKPNIRISEAPGKLLRHWFMLPTLTNRHTPQLCISRVNYKNARCNLIADEGIVVDANFSTLWMVTGGKHQVYALFALLNSTWTHAYLEAIATVMGGGALKVEASHIRRLLLPLPTNELITMLSFHGKRLAEEGPSENSNNIYEIDRTILRSLRDGLDLQEKCVAFRNYLQSKITARQR